MLSVLYVSTSASKLNLNICGSRCGALFSTLYLPWSYRGGSGGQRKQLLDANVGVAGGHMYLLN